MRYEPYEDEYRAVPTMTDDELFEYFLFSILETDEIWGLKEGGRWLTRQIGEQETVPVWPYKRFAVDAATEYWQDYAPSADSLEHFIYNTLSYYAEQGIMLEIMPRGMGAGCLVHPQRFVTIVENTMHSAEYTLED